MLPIVPQILLMGGRGTTSVSAADGTRRTPGRAALVVGDVLFVRNGEDSAAFLMPGAPRTDTSPIAVSAGLRHRASASE